MIEVHIHGPATTDKVRVRRVLESLVDNPSEWDHPPPEMLVISVEPKEGQPLDYKRSAEHAKHDYSLPAFVRAQLVLLDLPATESMVLREANMMPVLYAMKDGRPCRVNILSTLGDIGIAWDLTKANGYDERDLSIYDLTDFVSGS